MSYTTNLGPLQQVPLAFLQKPFALPPPCDGPRLESRHPFAVASLPPNLEVGGSESLSPMQGFSPFRELSSGLPDVTAAHLRPDLTEDRGSSNWPDLM